MYDLRLPAATFFRRPGITVHRGIKFASSWMIIIILGNHRRDGNESHDAPDGCFEHLLLREWFVFIVSSTQTAGEIGFSRLGKTGSESMHVLVARWHLLLCKGTVVTLFQGLSATCKAKQPHIYLKTDTLVE